MWLYLTLYCIFMLFALHGVKDTARYMDAEEYGEFAKVAKNFNTWFKVLGAFLTICIVLMAAIYLGGY